ncbi:MAG TPA: T9SS type A sorting domain-containing protein [Hymenobacter sp.]|uniref:T9SS type A sorting domain-containing protein n=1 Tax=Hymenobacter sp. TaxID=1898978 RepID=UPI002D808C4B|nr:T9SS type A sorting domain-containing protein [Hymenobacter sp.]HET9504577.1 T9SS type A sorting domain-containing protein [Hymenobacter sp.]
MVTRSTLYFSLKRASWLCALLCWLPLLSWAQTTLVNYDFNTLTSTSNYPVDPLTTAPGITSEATGSDPIVFYGGTSTGNAAFVANTAGLALSMNNSSGNVRYFQFSLAGAALPKYAAFKIYLQGYRSATGATTLTLQYSVSGGAFQTFGSTYAPGNAVFTEGGFDLSGLPTLNTPSSLTFRLVASGASATGSLRIDNFQVQAINTVDPFINSLSPSTVAAGGPNLPLTITGSNFAAGAVVSFNGQNVATTYNSATSLTALVPAAATAAPGSYPVVVANPSGTSSAAVSFVVTNVVPRWTGAAGTTSWFDAPNWSTGTVPGTADDVLLDHSFVAAGYTVSFDQSTAVSIRSLVVNPGAGDSIFVVVPATNTAATALTLSNTGAGATALAIYNKGVVTNASGASSGDGIDATGSSATVFIYNGGSYRHASGRSHAALVENLSAAIGTEQGVFDFRLPASAISSYAISVSNRTYGTLILRNRLNQPSTSYPAAGNTLTIQGDLVIGPGVTFTPTITNDLRVAGNVRVQGLLQLKNTTAGSTTSQLVFGGSKVQTISGLISFEPGIGLAVNNPAGVVLATPLTLGGPLALRSGNLTTTATNLLTLSSAAALATTSSTSFVNGPLARQTSAGAVSNLVFPTGSGASYRPVILNATAQDATTYLVTQKEGMPTNAASFVAGTSALPTLTRVSRVRSYTIMPTPAANNFSGTVTLSFGPDDGVSQPADASFTVGKNSNGAGWQNIGNGGVNVTTAATATTGAVGAITSQPFTTFSDFALASTSTNQDVNPLPVVLTSFGAVRQADGAVQVAWATASEKRSAYFEVQRSLDGTIYATIEKQAAQGTTTQAHLYTSLDQTAPACRLYYRLRQVDTDGTENFSPVVTLAATADATTLMLYPNPAHDELTLPAAGEQAQVLDLTGRVRQTSTLPASGKLSIAALPPGTYLLRVALNGQTHVLRFTKE